MTNLGGILDVAVGMSFVYFLLSLFCSGLNELVAWLAGLRGKTLQQGIHTMLADRDLGRLTRRVYEHPLVEGLSHQGRLGRWLRRSPSYIPAGTFVLALLDTLGDPASDPARLRAALKDSLAKLGAGDPGYEALEALERVLDTVAPADVRARLAAIVAEIPEGEAKEALVALVGRRRADSIESVRAILAGLPETSRVRRQLEVHVDAGMTDMVEYRKRLEAWFEQGMDRLSGAYKRRAQLISVCVGLALAVGTGVDSWVVANALMRDGALRQATVAAAVEASKLSPAESPSGDVDEKAAVDRMTGAISKLDTLQLPIGLPALLKAAPPTDAGTYWLLRALGMLFTGFAAALGAPFWFDMLGRIINLRASGPPAKD